jgi:Protein of unknown function (DUF2934)
MTGPSARRVTETVADAQADDPMRRAPTIPEAADEYSSSLPDAAAIAQESAAIYPDTNEGAPTPEEIALEAYRIYMGRGAHHGRDLEDWLEAERRLSKARARNT